jgi:hypothetical protein
MNCDSKMTTKLSSLRETTHVIDLDWVAQTFIKFKCQLKLNWHLKLLEKYMKIIYT